MYITAEFRVKFIGSSSLGKSYPATGEKSEHFAFERFGLALEWFDQMVASLRIQGGHCLGYHQTESNFTSCRANQVTTWLQYSVMQHSPLSPHIEKMGKPFREKSNEQNFYV